MDIKPDRLAFWFLRLNGFFTIPNFVVHAEEAGPDGRFLQRTEVDVMGVRFPFRAENRVRPMEDYPAFTDGRMHVVISEVKTTSCDINGPWTDAAKQNLQKMLCAGGFVPAQDVDAVAAVLYSTGAWEGNGLVIRIACFGAMANDDINKSHPGALQLTWNEVLPFIYRRFTSYYKEKRAHPQWEREGAELFDEAKASGSPENFIGRVHVTENPAPPP